MNEISGGEQNINLPPKREPDGIGKFKEELLKWERMVTTDEMYSPRSVIRESEAIMGSLKLEEKDKNMLRLTNQLMEAIGGKASLPRGDYKELSVKAQQAFVAEALSRFNGVGFEDNKMPEYFKSLTKIFDNMAREGFIDDDYCSLPGLRGMISAAILFKMEGYQVSLPPVNWDAYHDVDLLLEKEGRKFSLSVKSIKGHRDEDTESLLGFKVNMSRPADLPHEYYDTYKKHLWINIPSNLDNGSSNYFTGGNAGQSIGIPDESLVKELKHLIGIEGLEARWSH